MEIWKDIKYAKDYQISNYGRMYSKVSNKILKPHVHDNGYILYTLYENKKPIYRYAHRLVAEYFIENPNNLPQVHHIDNDRTNNRADNLMWVTAEENNNYKSDETREMYRRNAIKFRGKPIVEKINDEVSIGYLSLNSVSNMNVSTLSYHVDKGETHFKCKGREFYCPK